MDCPICKTTIGDIKENLFCPVCHWELAALPTNALSLRKDYEDRLVTFQSSYDNSDTIESLSNKIKCSQKENESVEKEIAKIKIEIRERTIEFGQLEMERTALLKTQREKCKQQKELKEIEQKIEMERSRLKDLLALNDKVKELDKAYKYAFHRGLSNKLGVIKIFLEDYNKIISEQ